MSRSDLNNLLIFVTGSSGFLGRWLIRRLADLKTPVIGIDLRPPPYQAVGHMSSDSGVTYLDGDISDMEFLADTFNRIYQNTNRKPAVCHLAGLSHVGECQADPLTAYDVNVLQTVRLLEACRKAKITRVVFPSTALVYGENHSGSLTEYDPIEPNTVYASSKLAAETVLHGYGRSYGFSCDIARFSNVYGPHSHPDTAVSMALDQAVKGEKIMLKSLAPVRDFIYCADAVEGLIRLLSAGDEPGCRIFNVSTGIASSIGHMVKTLCRVTGHPELMPGTKENDLTLESKLVLSNHKLVRRTGWKPVYGLEKGLLATWKVLTQKGR